MSDKSDERAAGGQLDREDTLEGGRGEVGGREEERRGGERRERGRKRNGRRREREMEEKVSGLQVKLLYSSVTDRMAHVSCDVFKEKGDESDVQLV